MTTKLDDHIRRAREQANMLAEEVRILQECSDTRAEEAKRRARKATEHAKEVGRLVREIYGLKDDEGA